MDATVQPADALICSIVQCLLPMTADALRVHACADEADEHD